jgi:bacillopeptidase F (M6 metalloprotease family)
LRLLFIIFSGSAAKSRPPRHMRFLDHTKRRATVGRTPVDEWSARCRDLYLATHNRQTSIPPVGFEPTIAAGERSYTYALDRAASGTGSQWVWYNQKTGKANKYVTETESRVRVGKHLSDLSPICMVWNKEMLYRYFFSTLL